MEKPTDALTGLILDTELNPGVEGLIAQNTEFALVALDIDNLTAINNDFGHDAGDAVFRLVAKHIGALFPSPCVAYRGTRDHFSVLAPGISKEEAFLKAERLRKLVNEEKLGCNAPDGRALTQAVSLGVSSYPEDGSRPADVLRKAEGALIRAKKNGRNAVCLAREEKLVPKTSHYTQAQLEGLSQVSEQVSVGEAALLREALDDLIRKYDIDIR